MYAVIKSGGKQYRVSPGQRIRIELLDAEVGSAVQLTDVLMVADGENIKCGKPIVDGASVKATVNGHGRHDKVIIFKHRRRKHYKKTQGHRQHYTELTIDAISA